ncbi:MAG TPA: APC family permease, partial [bacterium]|nr:APC family permease [bacterium]
FIGFEWITPLGFGPGAYQRKIPLSMPTAILINIIAYSFLVLGFSAQLPTEVITAESIPQVPYFIQILGPNGIYVAAFLSVLAIFSTFNAGVMGGSRLIFILTREGNLPKWCAKISFRTGAPIGAIGVLGGLAIISAIVVVTYELEAFAAIVGTTIVCFVYAAFMLAVYRLRRTKPDTDRPFRTPVYSVIQWFVIITMPAIGLMGLFSLPTLSPVIGLIGFVIIAALLTRWSILRTAQRAAAKKSGTRERELERSY